MGFLHLSNDWLNLLSINSRAMLNQSSSTEERKIKWGHCKLGNNILKYIKMDKHFTSVAMKQ